MQLRRRLKQPTLHTPGFLALPLQFHQHMFSMRIDPAVDDSDGGAGLVVSEASAAPSHAAQCCCTLTTEKGDNQPAS